VKVRAEAAMSLPLEDTIDTIGRSAAVSVGNSIAK
jgi:hypothetical protein